MSRDSSVWSLSLGRWGGAAIRLHASFLLFALLTLFLSAADAKGETFVFGCIALLVLFVSVAAHEGGHALTAMQLGGRVDEVLLSPIGGLRFPAVPANHACQLLTAVSGPLVNLTLVVLALLPIVWLDGGWGWLNLLNPIAPHGILDGNLGLVAVKLTFWINWMLLWLNVLPAPPMDGARMFRALMAPAVGYRRAVQSVALVAQLTAVCLLAVAWVFRHSNAVLLASDPNVPPGIVVPTWVPLVLLSTVLFFSARLELEKLQRRFVGDDLAGLELESGFEPVEAASTESGPPEPGPIRKWLERRRTNRERQQSLAEEEDDWRLDDILARMHEFGPHSLSAEDRAILERVSARYRSRLEHGS